VTHKFITITGEVKNPCTRYVPLGMSVEDVVALAGGITVENPVYLMGGPMTGNLCSKYELITKTSNAIIVLPENHLVVQKKRENTQISMKRAMASCCQCEMCTDLCPRNLLGHPIEPHMFMRAASSGTTKDVGPFLNTFFCCSCGLCEMYSCNQGLSPRTLITQYKGGLRANGVKPPKVEATPVKKQRPLRRVPIARLRARLGLEKYNVKAPLDESVIVVDHVRIRLSQHIGAPAVPIVKVGDVVKEGQKIGEAKENALSLPVHASIDGVVTEVTDREIMIRAQK
jgi:Na+-translocating ferredoxin:NAD+ oxidoreductase RnfC subunit